MDVHSLRVLEYDAVRARLLELASCSLGQERIATMAPSPDPHEVRRRLAATTEAVRVLDGAGQVPFGGIRDIRPHLRAASVDGLLDPDALLEVAGTAAGARRLRAFLLQREETCPLLAEMARCLSEFPQIEAAILSAISEQAEVRDDASAALARTRKEMRTVRGRMTERLNAILRNPAFREMLQDSVITTRDGRYCIPVKSEYRAQFGGLVHDQSASGATVFMEPAGVVELGNELRQLEAKERHEVERILRELTARIGKFASPFGETVEVLADLDFVFARARLSHRMDAVEPMINEEGFLALRRARHPLLAVDVVPIDLELGREHTVLVITGPNTGGKTVTLKTAGLLCLMAQSGLHVPADDGSNVPVFRGIYADIGDEQSIQQSLSTFSGHITNIARILREVEVSGDRSLVLLDEVGAGTDPTEGAALAKALIHHLLQVGARTIATTHYGELKEFAYSTPGVENASVEFDMQTLRPTYRLMIGVPGTSNAFAIAARLGLPSGIVEAARGMIGTDRAVLSDVIQRLTDEQRATESDLRRAARAAKEAEEKRAEFERKLRQLEADRAETLRRAREKAEAMVRDADRALERFRNEIRALEKGLRRASTEPDPAAVQKLRSRLQKLAEQLPRSRAARIAALPAPPPPPPAEVVTETDSRPPAPGDLVWIAELSQRGTMLSGPADGKAQVQVGSMRMTLPWESLRRVATPGRSGAVERPCAAGAGAPARRGDAGLRARAAISPEVNLRGMRAEEAMSRLDEYVDEACMAGLSPFRIVHGKGTGALKKVVWEFLQGHPNVAAFRHPPEEEGGTGVTVAELRE